MLMATNNHIFWDLSASFLLSVSNNNVDVYQYTVLIQPCISLFSFLFSLIPRKLNASVKLECIGGEMNFFLLPKQTHSPSLIMLMLYWFYLKTERGCPLFGLPTNSCPTDLRQANSENFVSHNNQRSAY